MPIKRYSSAAIALHWSIAVLLAFQLGLGWRMVGLGSLAAMYAPFQFHKSIGITILTLSLLRVVIRLTRPRPPVHIGGWQGRLASVVHGALYLFMLGGPLTGWMLVSTARIAIPTRLYGMIPLPHLPLGQIWHEPAETAHGLLAWLGLALVVLHIAGALRHHLSGSEGGVIDRMVPGAGEGQRALFPGIVGAAAISAAFVLPWLVYKPELAKAAPAVAASVEAGTDMTPVADESSTAIDPVNAAASSTPSEAADDAEAAPPTWQVLPGGTLSFRVVVNGENVEGRFSDWTANVTLDPKDTRGGSIIVRIPVLTASTGDETRDTMLKGTDFFGAGPPTATFRSAAITKLGGTAYSATGMLALNGVTKSVNLRFNLTVKDGVANVTGTGSLARTAFGVGKGNFAGTDQIADTVGVSFTFKARQAK